MRPAIPIELFAFKPKEVNPVLGKSRNAGKLVMLALVVAAFDDQCTYALPACFSSGGSSSSSSSRRSCSRFASIGPSQQQCQQEQ